MKSENTLDNLMVFMLFWTVVILLIIDFFIVIEFVFIEFVPINTRQMSSLPDNAEGLAFSLLLFTLLYWYSNTYKNSKIIRLANAFYKFMPKWLMGLAFIIYTLKVIHNMFIKYTI